MRGINQIHVKSQIGLNFADGLRSIVRQDPDVIMVGDTARFNATGEDVDGTIARYSWIVNGIKVEGVSGQLPFLEVTKSSPQSLSIAVSSIDNYDYLVPNGYYGNDSHKMVKMAALELLKTQNLTRRYGGLIAVKDVNFN